MEAAGHAEGGNGVESDHVHERHGAIAIDVHVRVPLSEITHEALGVGEARVCDHVGRDVLGRHLRHTPERGQRRDALEAREARIRHLDE